MASARKIRITHVMQDHLPVGEVEINDEALFKVAFSQFGVMQAILSNPSALVLQEGLCEDYTPELLSKNQNAVLVKRVFPNGLPKQFNQLNADQKDYIARRMGSVTLFDMGLLSRVHKTIDRKQNAIVTALILDQKFDAIYEHRELLAIQHAKLAVNDSKSANDHVLMVFGGVHDFKKTISESKDPTVVYAGSIETAKKEQVITTKQILAELKNLANKPLTSVDHDQSMDIDISAIPSSQSELLMSPPPSNVMQDGVNDIAQALSASPLLSLFSQNVLVEPAVDLSKVSAALGNLF